jgi:hypothetical protein
VVISFHVLVPQSFEKAHEYFRRKVAFVQKQMSKVQDAGNEKVKMRSILDDVFQAKVQAQMQAQQAQSQAIANKPIPSVS